MTVNATAAEQNTTGESGAAGRGDHQAVSADDSRFLGASTDEILANFEVGDQISDQHRDKLAGLLRCYPEVFSRSYADIGSYRGEDVDLETRAGHSSTVHKAVPHPLGAGATAEGAA